MLFNSLSFTFFLPIVFLLYWFPTRGKVRAQNILLLVSSYFFYACWDWRFLFLLVFSTGLDFITGLKIFESSTDKQKRFWFWLSVFVNLGFLGIFKYYNFFADSFAEVLSLLGFQVGFGTLQIILPVGISFYTFHGLSYVIDIYNKKIVPEKNFINYSVFVSFFPLLVAGPIERATHLLPQIIAKREFNILKASDGLRQILWGLFKKVVIADNCAEFSNAFFNNSSHYSGSALALGAVFFAFQIYCDFSGYSDIAIGTARLFGIELLRNFAFPYFSRDIAEFWRRWHISLSGWFRDYVYIPLGGSKGTTLIKTRNIFLIFILSGLWHGANWTFVAWGLINALFFLPLLLTEKNRNNIDIVGLNQKLRVKDFFLMFLTFAMTVFAWIFFRASSIGNALSYISEIFSSSFFSEPEFSNRGRAGTTSILIIVFILIEWFGRKGQDPVSQLCLNFSKPVRYFFYYLIMFSVFWFGAKPEPFIYFQF